jgi:hypothetical protein
VVQVSNAALDAAGAEDERFSGPGGRAFGWVGVGVAVAMVVLALSGDLVRDRKVVYLAVFLAAGCWVVLIRPAVSSNANGVVLRNMLRDTFVPWSKIERCRVLQTLQIATDECHFHGLGVSRSARTMVKKSYGRTSFMMRGMMFGQAGRVFDRPPEPADRPLAQRAQQGVAYQDYVEDRISARAHQSRADDLEPIVSWSPPALTAVAVAVVVLLLLVVA